MLSGEIDFNDMYERTIGQKSYVGIVLAYAFVILFIFLVVIVLVNLLNGVAIHDTREIMTQSEVLLQQSRLDILAYFERTLVSKLNLIEIDFKKGTNI